MSAATTIPEIQSNTRQEIGVMIGFMAIFVLVLTGFSIMWRTQNARQAQIEEDRRRDLNEKGFGLRAGAGAGGAFVGGEKDAGGVEEERRERR